MVKKNHYLVTASVSASLLAVVAASCGKKDSKNDTSSAPAPVATTAAKVQEKITDAENSTVVTETKQLQLSSALVLLPAKGSSTSLHGDEEQDVVLQLADDSGTTRQVQLRVSSEAFEGLDQVGNIMCFISQTKFWEQANTGVYKALVDESKCSNEKSGGGSGGGGGGGGNSDANKKQELQVVYVKSTREEGKPLVAELRILGTGGEDDAHYHARVVVAAPPSKTDPAGIFSMYFTGYQKGDTSKAAGKGYIRTKRADGGKFVLEAGMTHDEGNGTGSMQTSAVLEKVANDEFIGIVQTKQEGTHDGNTHKSESKARFDQNYVNVLGKTEYTHNGQANQTSTDGCYDRNKYKTAIYRYDLVGTDGKTVALNSGFPIEIESSGKTYQGHASYWGVWHPENVSLSNGDTVYKVDWGTDGGSKTRTAHTIVKSAGKLVKYTKNSTTLGALKGVDLNMWDNGTGYVVRWDGSKLQKVAKQVQGDKGMSEEAASGDVTIPEWGLHLWVSNLNASVQISNDVTLSDSLVISYHSQTTVSGTSDVPSESLVCFSNCPVMQPAASAFQRNNQQSNGPSSSALYKTTTVTWDKEYTTNQASNISTALATYSWDNSALLLKEGSTAFALPTGLPTKEDELRNLDNVHSGALIPSSVWSAISDKTKDPWAIEQSLDSFYRWEAGPSPWSQFYGLKDSTGAFVKFDKPLELSYTHTTAADWDGITDSNIIGKSYRLTYGGPGQFWGIPWKYNGEVGHEVPLFSIKSGTKIGDYTLYAVDGDQRMKKADSTASCSALGFDAAPALPALEDKSINVGTIGDDSSPLRYIGGSAPK